MAEQTALVTGAGSGIGRIVAQALAGDGFQLVLTGRRREPLEETAASLGSGIATLVHTCDVAEPSEVSRLFDATVQRFGRLDLLFNNAGIAAPAVAFEDLSYEQWSRVVATNLTGVFLCTQHAFRVMRDQDPQGGRIINNGSISAHVPRPNSAPYTSTKHAVTGLTKSTSLDGRRYRIAVGQIDIGNAATEMTAGFAAATLQADGTMRAEPTFDGTHVGEAVSFMAKLPLDTNVQFLTVVATAMPYIGRG